ncbi:unnamed protein product [Cunninghamella echinulata]
MNSLYQVDDLVKEYLLFRGFTNTFRALETESRVDKDKGFQVDKILDELQFLLPMGMFHGTVKKFEICLLRHYLVHAVQHKKRDKVKEFFESFGPELHGKPEWSQWFALAYVKTPNTDPVFETYFTKQWVDNYTTSLFNFLSTIFQNMPLPSLLAFNVDQAQRKTQQTEIETLKSTVDHLKAMMEAKENEVAKLKVQLVDTRKEMTDGISLIRRRAASLTNSHQNKTNGNKIDTIASSSSTSLSTITTTNNTNENTLTEITTNNIEKNEQVNNDNNSTDHKDESNNSNNNKNENNQDNNFDSPASTTGNDTTTELEDLFVVVSNEEFSEHASAITHAKFSTHGNLIASCDMDNIVRIWSYQGLSYSPQKLTSNTSNILSLEWDARSDRFLFLGTDTGTIRVYNTDNRNLVQEFNTTDKYPWVTQLSSSPVEPVIICAASNNKIKQNIKNQGALVAWNLKSMSSSGLFKLDAKEACTDVNTIKHNHNGQMLVVGDGAGTMRIFDVRTMNSIVEWQTVSKQPACMAQFSFDETSIYTIDHGGQLSQWSIHKPGVSVYNTQLQGFPPPPAFLPLSQPSISLSTQVSATPPRPKSNRSSSSRTSVSSSRSSRLPSITADDGVMQSRLSVSPRSQMVVFSSDTDYLLCATSPIDTILSSLSSSSIKSTSSSTSSSSSSANLIKNNNHHSSLTSPLSAIPEKSGETQGTIYQGSDGKPILQFGKQPIYNKITTVDWTSTANACLMGNMDGSIKVTNLIKTCY